MFSFFETAQLPIGLDISDMSIKLIQFRRNQNGQYEVQAYNNHELPKKVVVGGDIKDSKLLVHHLKAALGRANFGRFASVNVVASVPETKSFVRVIDMPAMSETEAREAVPWEAENYIPLPVGQVYLDWVILNNPPQGKMKALITASPKDYVDQLTEILQAAGLEPQAIEVEAQATARSMIPRWENSKTFLLADISTVGTSLIIFDHGILQFTSSLPIAGNSFTEKIAQALSLDMAQAEVLKQKVGLYEERDMQGSEVKKALTPVLNNLLQEIENTMRFYEEHAGGEKKIDKLLLTGGSSQLTGLIEFFQQQLQRQTAESDHPLRSLPELKVELGDPWVNVLPKNPPLPPEQSLSYTTAIGLALREF